MRLAVIGANGRTGSKVVELAVRRGHHVTAVTRRSERVAPRDGKLTLAQADVLDPGSIREALAGSSAVISTLGVGTSRAPTQLYSLGIENILAAMDVHGIVNLAVVSAAPAGPRDDQAFLERRLAMPILDRLFGATYEDMRRMESRLGASDADWVALRPPRLVEKPATGHYRLDASKPLPKARSLTYGDLAAALLDLLDATRPKRTAAYVAN